jgi:hypothetical protein
MTMKKHDMKKLAMLGLMGGLLIGTQGNADEEAVNLEAGQEIFAAQAGCPHHCPQKIKKPTASRDNYVADENQTTTKTMTQEELLPQLDKESQAIYNSLDVDGKKLALEMATKAKDKNAAIKAAKKIADKRAMQPK